MPMVGLFQFSGIETHQENGVLKSQVSLSGSAYDNTLNAVTTACESGPVARRFSIPSDKLSKD